MTTRGPFVVRLCTPDDSIAVDVRDLSFSTSWRGGYQDAQIRLNSPLDVRSPYLSPFAKLRIDDARDCRTVWEGYLDLPGKSRSDQGDVWQIGAVGPSARLSDRQRPYIVIDTQLSSWEQSFASNSGMAAQVGGLPGDEDTECLLLAFPQGIPIGNDARVTASYDALERTGQLLGGYSVTHQEGFTAGADQRFQVLGHLDGGVDDVPTNRLFNTVPITQGRDAGDGFLGVDKNVLKFRIIRETGGATNVNNDNWWSGITLARVSAMRRFQNGTYITGAGTYEDFTILDYVVPDALYWFTAQLIGADWVGPIDIANASMETGILNQHVDQLAYTEPTTMQQVLDDFTLLNPNLAWGVFESNDRGQHRFAYWAVRDGSTLSPSSDANPEKSGARYLATAQDGWDSPGGEADLRSSITITWTDRREKQHTRTYLASNFDIEVPELEQWAITRDADVIDLGPELGSVANADKIAEQVLTQASSPPESGTLTVARKIRDLWDGRDVEPWEVEPGYPLLIQDVDLDPLPITEVSYSDNDASASLTLSEPVLTTDQLVNRLTRGRRRG